MDLTLFPPIAAALDLGYRLLASLTAVLDPVAGGAAASIAIVAVTVAARIAVLPAAVAQARAERERLRLAPRLAELQRRHRGDPEPLRREMTDLYARERVSPLAGCLPALVQAPVFSLVYALFVLPVIAGRPNALLDELLVGVPLGASLGGALTAGSVSPALALITVCFSVVAVAIGEVTRRCFRPAMDAAPGAATPGPAAAAGMTRLLGSLTFITAVVIPFVPLAAAVYLLTSSVWTLGQRLVLRRLVVERRRAEPGDGSAGVARPTG